MPDIASTGSLGRRYLDAAALGRQAVGGQTSPWSTPPGHCRQDSEFFFGSSVTSMLATVTMAHVQTGRSSGLVLAGCTHPVVVDVILRVCSQFGRQVDVVGSPLDHLGVASDQIRSLAFPAGSLVIVPRCHWFTGELLAADACRALKQSCRGAVLVLDSAQALGSACFGDDLDGAPVGDIEVFSLSKYCGLARPLGIMAVRVDPTLEPYRTALAALDPFGQMFLRPGTTGWWPDNTCDTTGAKEVANVLSLLYDPAWVADRKRVLASNQEILVDALTGAPDVSLLVDRDNLHRTNRAIVAVQMPAKQGVEVSARLTAKGFIHTQYHVPDETESVYLRFTSPFIDLSPQDADAFSEAFWLR